MFHFSMGWQKFYQQNKFKSLQHREGVVV